MARWEGKSKGTVAGYKIFVFFIRYAGVRSAYFVLNFVAAYYFLFLKQSNRAIYYYFRERLGYPAFKSRRMVFRSYYTFGQTIIDKVAISSGLSDRFTFEFDGIEILQSLLAEQQGAVLISAHIGNFEIAEHFFGQLDLNFRINQVTTDLEHSAIKEYLESISKKPSVRTILIKEDLSHIFEINAALARAELVCFTGDRFVEGTRHLRGNLLGEAAHFPAGPFLIASRLNVPVVFVYVMKESDTHYHLYARRSQASRRDPQGVLEEYTKSVSAMLERYPLQWFNYFDFWAK